jgi:AcrR family transcriptional regulator
MSKATLRSAAAAGELEGIFPASQKRSRASQERLLDAGEAVFGRMGYNNAHVADIASAAGCSVGSFYRRFRDKEALFRALHQKIIEQRRQRNELFYARPELADLPSAEVIRLFVKDILGYFKQNAGFIRALFQRTLDEGNQNYWPELRSAAALEGRGLARFLRSRGELGASKARYDCDFIVRVIEGTIVHAVLHAGNALKNEEQFLDDLARVAVRYLEVGGLCRRTTQAKKA